MERCISRPYASVDKNTGEISTRLVVNPNKLTGEDGWCQTYEEFNSSLWEILDELDVDSYSTLRVDFAFDYFVDNYEEMHKLHKCICILASMHSKSSNNYESFDPLTFDHKTTTSKNQYYEVENYNKRIESHGKSPIANRLELRSKKLAKKGTKYIGVEDLAEKWIARIDKFESLFDRMQTRCNWSLIKQWNIEKQSVQIKSFSEFLRKYQNNIFTSNQLRDLYFRFDGQKLSEYNKAINRAKNFRRSNKIEFIKPKEIHNYLSILKQCLKSYVKKSADNTLFENENNPENSLDYRGITNIEFRDMT